MINTLDSKDVDGMVIIAHDTYNELPTKNSKRILHQEYILINPTYIERLHS